MDYYGCHMIHGIKNMDYVLVQWTGNKNYLLSYRRLFLTGQYVIKPCQQMCIRYWALHDITMCPWEYQKHLEAVHSI